MSESNARRRAALQGLYVITDTTRFVRDELVQAVGDAIEGGARIVQYRDKSDDTDRRRAEAAALSALCLRHDCTFIVNDDIDLAIDVGADGVHLGRDDHALVDARQRFEEMGLDAIIGVSCYADRQRAEHAAAAGADYLAFGAMFPSPTKPHAPSASAELLAWARERLGLPVCAIGGITADNIVDLLPYHPDMVAVISEVFSSTDIRAAAAALAEQITKIHDDSETA
ncbi:thiamine phosphate synthase [Guyparkeria sp.]|uniref:thiamine phosphate synthase n=1 Tax=Guyparkeria sp. TaxID=2035736 RepID=UPI003568216A